MDLHHPDRLLQHLERLLADLDRLLADIAPLEVWVLVLGWAVLWRVFAERRRERRARSYSLDGGGYPPCDGCSDCGGGDGGDGGDGGGD